MPLRGVQLLELLLWLPNDMSVGGSIIEAGVAVESLIEIVACCNEENPKMVLLFLSIKT
jgi:hypothetical protein